MSPATSPFDGPIPILTDGVVTLRGLSPNDIETIVQYCRDPLLARWTSVPEPYTQTDAQHWLGQAADGWITGERCQFAVLTEERLVGDLSLRFEGGGLGDVGFSLAPEARGRGLITRALRLAIAWGFREGQLDVLHWRAQVGNWAARRAAWAVGFRVGTAIPGLLDQRGTRVDGWIGTLRRGDPLEPAHAWLDPEQILGKLVNLREHREQDVPRIVEAIRDPVTLRWLSKIPDDYTPENARNHLQRIRAEQASGNGVYWAVADPEDDRMLGEMAIFIRDPTDPHGEVGYWTHPDGRGQGRTTEAAQLAVRHALLPAEEGGLGLTRILLRAATGNRASQRVAEKAGFIRAGLDRQADRLRDGTVVDDLRFDLLADELPAVR